MRVNNNILLIFFDFYIFKILNFILTMSFIMRFWHCIIINAIEALVTKVILWYTRSRILSTWTKTWPWWLNSLQYWCCCLFFPTISWYEKWNIWVLYMSAVIRHAILAAVCRPNVYTVSFHWRSERRTLFYLVCPGLSTNINVYWIDKFSL